MHCEFLEPRRLFAITLDHGTLAITGGKTADVISVHLIQGNAHVTMQRGTALEFDTFPASRIDTIRVKAKGGNDTVSIPWFDFRGRTIVHGGAGTDNVGVSTKGNARIYGGAGNDFLRGGSGDDLIKGQKGHDSLNGGEGNDTLVGGAGGDILHGAGGKDLFKARDNRVDIDITGGDGRDTVELDLGKDVPDDPESIERFMFLNGIEKIAQ